MNIRMVSATSKVALITGATSGIGKAVATIFAKNGISLVICGRREERLIALKTELQPFAPIYTLNFDVRDREDVAKKIKNLPKEFSKIDILINNAGNAHGMEPIDQGNLDDWEAMIDINVKGLLYVSKAVIPTMMENSSGHIINIGSSAGKEVYPKGNIYCASKHAVDAINQGMRMDLHTHGIRVGAINPGLVDTEFSQIRFKGDAERAASVYQGFKPLYAEDIAEIIYFVITRPYHINITDLLVMPLAQASNTLVNRKG